MKGLKYNLKCAIPGPAGSMRPTQCRRKSLGSRTFSHLVLWGHERSTEQWSSDEEYTQVSRNRGLCHFPRDCRGLPGIRVGTEAWTESRVALSAILAQPTRSRETRLWACGRHQANRGVAS